MQVKLKTDIVNGTITIPEGTVLNVVEYGERLYTEANIVYEKVLLENDEYCFHLSLQALMILTEEIKSS